MPNSPEDVYVAFRAELRVLRSMIVALTAERRAASGVGVAWLATQKKLALGALGPIDPNDVRDTQAALIIEEMFQAIEMVATAFEDRNKVN